MPGPMPYLLDKSAYFEIIEDLLADPARRIAILQQLRTGVALADLAGFDSANRGADGKTPDKRKEHLHEHWFGMSDATGSWQKQPGVFPTGFWSSYQGDPEAVLRTAMIRAIEVSLGLPPAFPGDPFAEQTDIERRWPVDVYWICQGPWFQCWVLWRQSDTTDEGHVTVLITTPAAEGFPLESKITRPIDPHDPPYQAPEYAIGPLPDARHNRHGMWVIGHEDHERRVVCSTEPSIGGDIKWPRVEWRAIDPDVVVCVSPAEWEGGVLHDGRPYVHP